jgi:hypothetical protein
VRSTSSDRAEREPFFCSEPWTGILSIETNRDVVFCPCYLQLPVGNLDESSMQEVWNAPELVWFRRAFSRGVIPEVCEGHLCPPVLRQEGGGPV